MEYMRIDGAKCTAYIFSHGDEIVSARVYIQNVFTTGLFTKTIFERQAVGDKVASVKREVPYRIIDNKEMGEGWAGLRTAANAREWKRVSSDSDFDSFDVCKLISLISGIKYCTALPSKVVLVDLELIA